MNAVKRMLYKALKNNEFAKVVNEHFCLVGINGGILNLNSDFDWSYEQSKINFIKELIEERDKYPIKFIKDVYRKQMRRTPYLWYDEFRSRARYILKNWRRLKKNSFFNK